MTLPKRLALFGVAAGLAALVLGVSATLANRTNAQVAPATLYGIGYAPGDVIEAFINDVSCATATADANGDWTMQIPAAPPCSPRDGDTVTFTRNGRAMVATETWRPLGRPADVANGVPGTLAAATPTPTPTPTPLPEVTEAVIAETLDLTTDATTVDGQQVVQARSADGAIIATIPLDAVAGTQTVDVAIDTVAEPDIATRVGMSIPAGTSYARAADIEIRNDQGQAIREFDGNVTFSVRVDTTQVGLAQDATCESFASSSASGSAPRQVSEPSDEIYWREFPGVKNFNSAKSNTSSISVFANEGGGAMWAELPRADVAVSADCTVEFRTSGLTLFAILRLPTVTWQLAAGLNSITYTGPSGTPAADVASEIGGSLESMLLFDAPTQSWQTYLPGAPAAVSTLQSLKPARPARSARAARRGGGVDRNGHHPGSERRSDGDAGPGPQLDRLHRR